jgi:pimeloyl-ACP methyl ester carboxylesterase
MFQVMHWALDMERTTEIEPRRIDAPMLFLTGSEDRVNSPGTVERIAGLFGGRATHEVLPGMGHWLIGEPGWEKLADRALAWLAERDL